MKIQKSGRLWCGEAREILPAFQDLSGISMIKPIILCTTWNFFGTIVIF